MIHTSLDLATAGKLQSTEGGTITIEADLTCTLRTGEDAQEEQAGLLTAAINAKYAYLEEAQRLAFGSLFAGYTPEQRETFWAQVGEAEKFTADNQTPTPFLSGRAAREGVELQTIVAEVLAMAGYAKAVNGDIYGEFRALTRQLADVDPAGDYAAELDKLNLIVW